jgi:hypothetical protein
MKFRITRDWPIAGGRKFLPAGTIVDTSDPKCPAKGLTIPINATCLDEESWRTQLALYGEQHKHLLGGGWI